MVMSWSLDVDTGCHKPDDPFDDPTFRGTRTGRTFVEWVNSSIIEPIGDFAVITVSYLPASDTINLVVCAYADERTAAGVAISARDLRKKVAEGAKIARSLKVNAAVTAVDLTVTNVYCDALKRANDDETTTTTATTTTTTLDPKKYAPQYFSEESKVREDCVNAEYVSDWGLWRAYCPK